MLVIISQTSKTHTNIRSSKLLQLNDTRFVHNSNPTPEGEQWPLYTRDEPVYYVFNAESDERHQTEQLGRGPMATACAFWNTYLPKLHVWTGTLSTLCKPFAVWRNWICSLLMIALVSITEPEEPCRSSVSVGSRTSVASSTAVLALSVASPLAALAVSLLQSTLLRLGGSW